MVKPINKNDLFNIISDCTKIPLNKLGLSTKREDFNTWDSIANIQIFVNLEEKTKKKISTSKIAELVSVKEIYGYFK